MLDDGRPRLRAPDIESLLAFAEVPAPSDAETRAAMLEAMRAAAKKRVEGVTANKRRRHYGHAASLAVTCTRIDSSPESEAWLKRLEEKYRRYPALQRAFKAAR